MPAPGEFQPLDPAGTTSLFVDGADQAEDSDDEYEPSTSGGATGFTEHSRFEFEQLVEEGTDEEEEEDEEAYPPRYCTNCTGRLDPGSSTCEDCGHDASEDREIFAGTLGMDGAAGAAQPAQQVALLWDDRMTLHEEGKLNPHPERPDRIRAVVARIMATHLHERCRRVACREATWDELSCVHSEQLIKFVQAAAAGTVGPGIGSLMTTDTYANAHTYTCARLAAGGSAEVAAMVARGEAAHGAAIVRPPGHHAESGMSMGFCFFNNAAVAAKAAQAAGAQRILILDWDIHHGNGTQHIFEDDPSVMYMSLHRYDGGHFYPGTGAVDEVGMGSGEGYTINVPWDARDMGNGDYLSAFNHVLIPIAYEFNPDLIIISAGFDAAEGDPIGECRLTPEGYAHMTAMLKTIAPVVILLEGGYNLKSTALGTEACLRVLLGEQPPNLPGPRYPSFFGWRAIQAALETQARYWRSLRPAAHSLAMQQAQAQRMAMLTEAKRQQMPLGGNPAIAAAAVRAQAVQVAAAVGGSSAAAAPQQQQQPSGLQQPQQQQQQPSGLQQPQQHAYAPTQGATHSRQQGDGRPPNSGQQESDAARNLSRKRQLLRAIHRRAVQAFWKRQRRAAEQQAALAGQQAAAAAPTVAGALPS